MTGSVDAAADANACCANCGVEARGAYCPRCGQPQGALVKPARLWLRELVAENFHMESRLPATFALLATRPGFLTAEWLAGRRARYLTPVTVYVLAALAFFAIPPLASGPIFFEPGTDLAFQPSMRILIPLASVPVLAIAARLSYGGLLRSLTPHAVFSLHVHAFVLLVAAVVTAAVRLLQLDPDALVIPVALAIATLAAVHLAAGARRVWDTTWWRAGLATLLAVLQWTILFLALLIAVGGAYVILVGTLGSG